MNKTKRKRRGHRLSKMCVTFDVSDRTKVIIRGYWVTFVFWRESFTVTLPEAIKIFESI